jgi:hypothetical protein
LIDWLVGKVEGRAIAMFGVSSALLDCHVDIIIIFTLPAQAGL